MSLNLGNIRYRVVALPPDGRKLYLDQLLLEGSWEEQPEELVARLEVQLKNVKVGGVWLHKYVSPGKRLVLQANDGGGWKEVFRGTVFRWATYPENEHIIDLTAGMSKTLNSWLPGCGFTGTKAKRARPRSRLPRTARRNSGFLQDVIYSSSYDSLKDAKKEADEILKEQGKPQKSRTVTAPDIPWIRKGDKVEVKVGTSVGGSLLKGFVSCIRKINWITLRR